MNTKKNAALMACGLMLAVCTACGESSGITIAEKDLPYGATLTRNDKDYAMGIQYDHRFIPEDCLHTVIDYYTAIQTQDVELFLSLQLPLYHDYQMNEVLGGEYTDEELVKNSYEAIKAFYGSDFIYSMIDITDGIAGTEYSTSANLLELLDDLAEDANQDKISDDIDAFYELTIDRYLTDVGSDVRSETDSALLEEKLFVFHYADDCYIIYN